MVVLDETHQTTLRWPSGADRPVAAVAPDQRAARRSLRDQIARLEHDLGACVVAAFPGQALDVSVTRTGGPRVLGLGELETLRDDLSLRLRDARATLARRGELQQRNRVLLEKMRLDPRRYKFVRLEREDLGVPGCGAWEVRPRLGLIGMLMGWWQVKLSSGCPLRVPRAADVADRGGPREDLPVPRAADGADRGGPRETLVN